jgi:SlyX protein
MPAVGLIIVEPRMEQRVVDLESRVAFQDDALEQLNRVVHEQQLQIDRLAKELDTVKQQLRALAPTLVAAPDEETPPPHY